MTNKQHRVLDLAIESSYYRQALGRQISMLDIPKLFSDARAKIIAGVDLDDAVCEAIARYCSD